MYFPLDSLYLRPKDKQNSSFISESQTIDFDDLIVVYVYVARACVVLARVVAGKLSLIG